MAYPPDTMKRSSLVQAIAATCLATATATQPAAADGAFAWPHGAKAAVSLAYDDRTRS